MTKKNANAPTRAEQRPAERAQSCSSSRRDREQHDARDVDRIDDAVRQDVVLEVDGRQRDQRGGEHEVRGQRPRVCEARADRGEQHAGEQLDERVAGRDRRRRSCGTGPRSTSHDTTGMLSRGRSSRRSPGQCDGGVTIDSCAEPAR